MDKLYFLIFVGVCAMGLIALGLNIERKHRARTKQRQEKARRQAQLHHRYHAGSYHHIHGHEVADIGRDHVWNSRRRHAGEEARRGSIISATKVFFDHEDMEEDTKDELQMSVVEFTSEEELPGGRRARRQVPGS